MRLAVGVVHATLAAMPPISHLFDEPDSELNRVAEVLDEVLTPPGSNGDKLALRLTPPK